VETGGRGREEKGRAESNLSSSASLSWLGEVGGGEARVCLPPKRSISWMLKKKEKEGEGGGKKKKRPVAAVAYSPINWLEKEGKKGTRGLTSFRVAGP